MKSNSPVPERILLLGLEGTGKSECWAATAAKYRDTHTAGTFYVLNTDPAGSVERVGERWADFASNVQWTNVRDWEALRTATTAYLALVEPGDWLIIDSGDKPWEWVRNAYESWWAEQNHATVTTMFGVPELPRDDKQWDRINGEYQKWILPLVDADRNPAHLMTTSPSQPVRVEGIFKDDQAIIDLFGKKGVRPAGQKHLSFQHHTVLLLKDRGSGNWVMDSVKDRSRELVDNSRIIDFPISYLLQIGGWSL